MWVFVSTPLDGNLNYSAPLPMEEFAKFYQFRSSSEYTEEVLRGETQRSPAVTSGKANYLNSSIIT